MSSFVKLWADAPAPARFGLIVVTVYLGIALFAPLLAPYGEAEVVGASFQPWSSQHWLGTDSLGRDVTSRMIYAARNTIGIALATTVLAFTVGSLFGMTAAVYGGWVDMLFGRTNDLLMAIPGLIFALLLLTIYGTSTMALIAVIAVIDATRVFRLARSVTADIVLMDYFEVAQLRGDSIIRLLLREILPNAAPPLIAEFGLRFVFVFLTISALSFLGLGIQPPTADWGSMVRETAILLTFGEIVPIIPAAAIALLTVAVNFIVDWLLDRAAGRRR